MQGGDPSFMQQAIGAGLLGTGAYGGLTSSAIAMEPTTAAMVAATLAIGSLFD
jgi:hypothetical protein